MAGANGSSSIMQPIIVGVVLALLVGGSAPWWWSEIGGGSDETTPTTPVPVTMPTSSPTSSPTTGATSGTTGTTATAASNEPIEVGNCQITIHNPLVSLREEPDHFALEVGRVEPGSYAVQEATIVNRGPVEQRWFRITADGRSGWLEDNSILIDSKSTGCP